jgi:hypothetical protein
MVTPSNPGQAGQGSITQDNTSPADSKKQADKK